MKDNERTLALKEMLKISDKHFPELKLLIKKELNNELENITIEHLLKKKVDILEDRKIEIRYNKVCKKLDYLFHFYYNDDKLTSVLIDFNSESNKIINKYRQDITGNALEILTIELEQLLEQEPHKKWLTFYKENV
jgi:hypothetical protein